MTAAQFFPLLQLGWALVWGLEHRRIRRGRHYALGRATHARNRSYRLLSYVLFAIQTPICLATFWTSSPLLLPFHHSDILRLIGFTLVIGATASYLQALRYLGRNYSPCYDAHLPVELITVGPYEYVRHPMYAAKLLLGLGFLLVSGSGWFVPVLVWQAVEMARSIVSEEAALHAALPQYERYRSRTKRLLPYLF